MNNTSIDIDIYKSFFKGRQDVYAVRWEKEGKSGYMPAYKIDWTDYRKYKSNGVSFKDYLKKDYQPLVDEVLLQHLKGIDTIGVYPLLEDNTSFFIAADFDESNWKESIIKLYSVCSRHKIPSYIERSRSGNGGHLWIFFEENLPSEKTRNMMYELLREASIISSYDKKPSFDRLFPNQNFHSGKGMGNLIALPLNGKALMSFNSAFLDPVNMQPYNNQLEALKSFCKLTTYNFKSVYEEIFNEKVEDFFKSSFDATSHPAIEIVINGQMYLKRLHLNRKLIEFIRENLNFLNSDFLVKKNMGKSTFDTEKYFRLIEETPDGVILPRGFAANLIAYCKKEGLSFKIIDNRRRLNPIDFESDIELRPEQERAIEKTLDKDFR